MNPNYLILCFLLFHAPAQILGRKGRKRQRQDDQNQTNYPKKEKPLKNLTKVTLEHAWKDKGSNSLEIIDAMNPELYKFPKDCSSKKEIHSNLERCITIWQNYCRCTECKGNACGEDEWPPKETEAWKLYNRHVGWEELKSAWKWAGKCAYNATSLWRIWCTDSGYVLDPVSRRRVKYDYWFLTQLHSSKNPTEVRRLCQQHECVKWKTNSTSASPTTRKEKGLTTSEKITSPPEKKQHVRINYMGNVSSSSSIGDIPTCDQQELTEILKPCAEIWQSYCKCYGCSNTCTENDNTLKSRSRSMSSQQHTHDMGAMEEHKHNLERAGTCAYNATELWRSWCGDGKSGDSSHEENEYWFLIKLRENPHIKLVQAYCEKYECPKWQDSSSAKTTTGEKGIDNELTTAKAFSQLTGQILTTSRQDPIGGLPWWIYSLLGAIGGFFVLLLIVILAFVLVRKRRGKKRNNNENLALRGQINGSRRETGTTNSISWQPQTSFSFFGERSMPNADDSIYHTIGESQPVQASPTFALETFSSPNRVSPRSRSVRNVLYQDTTPMSVNEGIPQYSVSVPGDLAETTAHAYEDAVLQNELKDDTAAVPPPDTPPYFTPIDVICENEATDEYSSLGTLEFGRDEKGARFGMTANNIGPSSSNDIDEQRGNYDHIKLL